MAYSMEKARDAAIVTASALKNPPVTPLRNARGVNTTIVAIEEPTSGRTISPAASRTLIVASLRRRVMCSSMTTISSTISPTAAAMPPSVMILRLSPNIIKSSAVEARTAGSKIATTSTNRRLRRKIKRTTPARMVPIKMESRTLFAADLTRSD